MNFELVIDITEIEIIARGMALGSYIACGVFMGLLIGVKLKGLPRYGFRLDVFDWQSYTGMKHMGSAGKK